MRRGRAFTLRKGFARSRDRQRRVDYAALRSSDRNLELVPEGAKGELYIGGIGVARGYLNKPDLTAERFLKNPFGEGRLYHTGDLVRWRPDGELEYLGRADTQVKINGLRVELGEIEKQLEALPWVDTAAAIVCPDASGVDRICAYATACDANKRPEFDEIVSHLRRTLPHHMIPSAVCGWKVSRLIPTASSIALHSRTRGTGEGAPHALAPCRRTIPNALWRRSGKIC